MYDNLLFENIFGPSIYTHLKDEFAKSSLSDDNKKELTNWLDTIQKDLRFKKMVDKQSYALYLLMGQKLEDVDVLRKEIEGQVRSMGDTQKVPPITIDTISKSPDQKFTIQLYSSYLKDKQSIIISLFQERKIAYFLFTVLSYLIAKKLGSTNKGLLFFALVTVGQMAINRLIKEKQDRLNVPWHVGYIIALGILLFFSVKVVTRKSIKETISFMKILLKDKLIIGVSGLFLLEVVTTTILYLYKLKPEAVRDFKFSPLISTSSTEEEPKAVNV